MALRLQRPVADPRALHKIFKETKKCGKPSYSTTKKNSFKYLKANSPSGKNLKRGDILIPPSCTKVKSDNCDKLCPDIENLEY